MMILDKHIGGHVVWGTALVLVVLLTLFSFTEFVEDLESVGQGRYTIWRAVEYMILSLPSRSFEIFPMAALIGSLLGLGVLASNSELIVVRASGVSLMRIIASVMKAGGVLMLIALVVGEVVAPFSERLAEERRALVLSTQVAPRAGQGFWVRDGTSFINIQQVLRGERMADIYIYEFDKSHRLRVSTFARRAHQCTPDDAVDMPFWAAALVNLCAQDEEWLLEDIAQSIVDEEGVRTRSVPKAVWHSVFEPELVNVITVRPESLSAVGLVRYLRYLEENGLSTSDYELALWGKLALPFATGVMIFLAVPLVLGKLRTVGIGLRVLVGTLVGIVFWVIQKTAVHMGDVYGLTPFLSAVAPTLLFLVLGLLLIKQVH